MIRQRALVSSLLIAITACWFSLGVSAGQSVAGTGAAASDSDGSGVSSRAWHILRQEGIGPLLAPMAIRLHKVSLPSRRTESMWTGVEHNAATGRLNIATEGDVAGEIVVGFFVDPVWSDEPVQVRAFPGPGECIVEGLCPGEYVVGAMVGTGLDPLALGVNRAWPTPVQVKAGETVAVDVLISSEFEPALGYAYRDIVREALTRGREIVEGSGLLHGRVTGPDGRPVSYARVHIREDDPQARRLIAVNTGTDKQGYYRYDGTAPSYQVYVYWKEPAFPSMGYRGRSIRRDSVLGGPQTVDFQFGAFPQGSVTLTGRVADQDGDPVQGFFVSAFTNVDSTASSRDYPYRVGYQLPFMTADGRFRLDGLAAGVYTVRCYPFDRHAYDLRHAPRTVALDNGGTEQISFTVDKKRTFYGRVLFEDGAAAVIDPPPWPGGTTTILLHNHGGGRYVLGEVDGEGYFPVHLSDAEIDDILAGKCQLNVLCPMPDGADTWVIVGSFPLDLLSPEQGKAGVARVPRPDLAREEPFSASEPSQLVGMTASDLNVAEWVNGEPVTLEGLRDRAVVLALFELHPQQWSDLVPVLSRLRAHYSNAEVEIIAVCAAEAEVDALSRSVRDHSVAFRVAIDKPSTRGLYKGLTFEKYRAWRLPAVYIVDAKGKVKYQDIGLNVVEQAVKSLLDEQ